MNWKVSAALGCAGCLVVVTGSSSSANLPFSVDNVPLSIVGVLLLSQAASFAVWTDAPWWAWRSRRAPWMVMAVPAVVLVGPVVLVLTIHQVQSGRHVLTAAVGGIALGWAAVALTGGVRWAWVLSAGAVLLDLMVSWSLPPLWSGLSVAAWFAPTDLRTLFVPSVVLVASFCAAVRVVGSARP